MPRQPRRVTKPVPIASIVKSRLYTRSSPGAEEFARFVRSIEQTGGPLQAPVVRARGKSRYEIIAGHQRWQAALRAKQKTLTVTVVEATDVEALRLMYAENRHRSNPNAVEEAEQLHMLARLLESSRSARGGSTTRYLSERKAAGLLADVIHEKPETIRGKLGMLPMDPANVERLRAAGVSFEHCRRARQIISRTEIATADQEKWWVDLTVEATKKGWSVKEMWRAGHERHRLRNQRQLIPGMIKPWEPPKRKYEVCETCGQPWGAHLCPYKIYHGGSTTQAKNRR